MTLIALSGEIGAGKDTFGDILADRFGFAGYDVELVKFAQPLKEVIARLGIPDGRELKEVVQKYQIDAQALYNAIECVFQFMSMKDRQVLAFEMHAKLVRCNWEFSPRQFQQWLGMGAREIRADYFIHHLRQYTGCKPGTVFIVTDGRFMNEREVADTGIHIVRRDNPLRVESNDASEKSLDLLADAAEFVVYNEEREDWQEFLQDQADVIIDFMEHRGYCDDVEITGGAGE